LEAGITYKGWLLHKVEGLNPVRNSALFENVVIITGASMGIGRELALQLADKGAWLSLAARDANMLEYVAAQCRQRGAKAIVIPTDVTIQSQCSHLIERTVSEYGRIDTLINNAGLSMFARFDEIQDLTILDQTMKVNYFGSVYCTFYALPYLKATKGRIAAISSIAGKKGVPKKIGYSASKHAMVGFFNTLRIECYDDGVSVTVIFPGYVATAIRERMLGPDAKPFGKSPMHETGLMTGDICASLVIKAIVRRKRELIMNPRSRIVLWLNFIAPELAEKFSRKAYKE